MPKKKTTKSRYTNAKYSTNQPASNKNSQTPSYLKEEVKLLKDIIVLSYYHDLSKEELQYLLFGVKLNFIIERDDNSQSKFNDNSQSKFKDTLSKIITEELTTGVSPSVSLSVSPSDDKLIFIDVIKVILYLTGACNIIKLNYVPTFQELYNYVKFNKSISLCVKRLLAQEFTKCLILKDNLKGVSLEEILIFASKIKNIILTESFMKFILDNSILINKNKKELMLLKIESITILDEILTNTLTTHIFELQQPNNLNINSYISGKEAERLLEKKNILITYFDDKKCNIGVADCSFMREKSSYSVEQCELYLIIKKPDEIML